MKTSILSYTTALLLSTFTALTESRAQSTVPLAINYQAILTDDDGNLLAANEPKNYPVEFRIFGSLAGGDALWAESQGVTVFQGSFSTLLGTGDSIAPILEGEPHPPLDEVFNGADRYLEITVINGDEVRTFAPRQRMVSTPYAFRSKWAGVAETVVDGSIGQNQLSNGAVTTAKLASNAVTREVLADNSIDSTKIANNAIGTDNIADGQVRNPDIEDGAVDLDKLAAAVQSRLVPAGTVMAWAGLAAPESQTIDGVEIDGVPEGWVLCWGQPADPEKYPELFRAIGYIYGGEGDRFNVPDYRGYFLRGGETRLYKDDGSADAGRDPDRKDRDKSSPWAASASLFEGSTQKGAFEKHTHTLARGYGGDEDLIHGDDSSHSDEGFGEDDPQRGNGIKATGGNETRPINRYVHYIIKAK